MILLNEGRGVCTPHTSALGCGRSVRGDVRGAGRADRSVWHVALSSDLGLTRWRGCGARVQSYERRSAFGSSGGARSPKLQQASRWLGQCKDTLAFDWHLAVHRATARTRLKPFLARHCGDDVLLVASFAWLAVAQIEHPEDILLRLQRVVRARLDHVARAALHGRTEAFLRELHALATGARERGALKHAVENARARAVQECGSLLGFVKLRIVRTRQCAQSRRGTSAHHGADGGGW